MIDKDFRLQPKQTSEPRRLRAFSPQLLQYFWSKLKKKNPKDCCDVPNVTTNNSRHREVTWQQYRLCLAGAEFQILGGKYVLIFGPESGKIWWLKKVQSLQKRYHCQWALLRDKKLEWILFVSIILATYYNNLSWSQPRVSCISKAKVVSTRAPQYRQYALISDFLDLANLDVREEAALATNWIKDRPERLKLQNLALATIQAWRSAIFQKI